LRILQAGILAKECFFPTFFEVTLPASTHRLKVSGFLQVFPFPLQSGIPATTLHDKYSVVLSEEMAVKLFGSPYAEPL